eukprot:6479889-Amphidinium_carterae.3
MTAAQCPPWLPDYIHGAMVTRKRGNIKDGVPTLCHEHWRKIGEVVQRLGQFMAPLQGLPP